LAASPAGRYHVPIAQALTATSLCLDRGRNPPPQAGKGRCHGTSQPRRHRSGLRGLDSRRCSRHAGCPTGVAGKGAPGRPSAMTANA
jgi:hypothetical protein